MGWGGQRHAPAALPPERLGTHCTGGWMGQRANLDRCGKSRPHRDSIPTLIYNTHFVDVHLLVCYIADTRI
jgi:hypothetical protein